VTLHVALTHRTSYSYDRLVLLGPQTIRLRPAPHARTPILAYALRIEPQGHFLNWQQDPQGNFLARVVFPERVDRFEVTVDLLADMATINPFDFFLDPDAENWPFAYDANLDAELMPFRQAAPPGPRLNGLLAGIDRGLQPTVPMLIALNARLRDQVDYVVRLEHGVWSPEQTLAEGRGSCRDSAWLLVQVARHLGLAARFVSGYLIQLKPDAGTQGDGPQGPGEDFTDLHAWAEIYLPGAGWVGFDVTSGLLTAEGHIPLAATPEPASAAPISGTLAGLPETRFAFAMTVRRMRETPRTTAPYTPDIWAAIERQGAAVDARLRSADIRLTMGGEPTFISATDPDAEEWNSAALGPTKRHHAGRLIRRLAELWSPGALIQSTIGRQYPDEPQPRWALAAFWRHDGVAVWKDPSLLADAVGGDPAEPPGTEGSAASGGTQRSALSCGPADAQAFARALAARLGLDPARVMAAYEDSHYFLWREQRLPPNVSPEDPRLADPAERERLARAFRGGLGSEVGSVLPLRRTRSGEGSRWESAAWESAAWESADWELRGGGLFLVPGDSAIGLRLPLAGLAWCEPSEITPEFEPDPFAALPPLPADPSPANYGHAQPHAQAQPQAPAPSRVPAPVATAGLPPADAGEPSPGALVRTALTVEPRSGVLHVFLPPLQRLEDWLELVEAVEATALQLARPVAVEGYGPPRDPRLASFSVTPDPGVIEVNIHPAASWAEQVSRTRQLYETARALGLATEKFLLDGRHVGTGGGNHMVLGGATPSDSPFLRRPDLLKSLLGFWHNHPSLSYLFSGLFIGPMSQHPRPDEARPDNLGELEIALAQITPGAPMPPGRIDRLLRNLLADVTGNTHRSEFCIDKLYAPQASTGRLGLVELRAVEMPPHPEMALAQILLLRAAVAAFWTRPYARRLTRWGTRLHDAFMLGHHVHEDLVAALDDLAEHGVALEPAWFAPHEAFRFPLIGSVAVGPVGLLLHGALEPWPVLGERPDAHATVRHVDTSNERVQVTVRDWDAERYVLACNGHGVPLAPTARAGEWVGGVRFKAWNATFCLHPALPAQSPLVFDIHDRWNGRSIGGVTYHTAHPGGRNYAARPVNAGEAEARRRVRFQPFGHTPGPAAEPRVAPGPDLPHTLDLRRAVLGLPG